MDKFIEVLLTQSPLVVLMVVGYYVMLKEKKELKKESISDRKSYRKEVKEQQEKHETKLEELNKYVRDHDEKFFASTDKLADALEKLKK